MKSQTGRDMMTYEEGTWHALIGLDPQYEHMKGCQAYDLYMEGYNKTNDKDKELEDEHSS